MTPHDDVPAERERDEHVERVTTALEEAMAQHGLAFEPVDDAAEVGATLAALLARQEAREPDIEALAEAVHDAYLATCARLGWDVKPENRVPYAELSEDSKELDRASVRAVLAGLAAARPAPETREPDGWAVRMRDGSWRSTVYKDPETAERMAVKAREFFAARGDEDDEFDSIDVLPVYLGAPMPSETLLPCPFCGGEAVRITTRYSENCDTVKANGGQTLFRGVKCIVCGARTSTVVGYRTPGEADAAWNRRATPQEAREDEFDPIDVLRGAWKAAREALGLPTAPEEGAGGMTDTEAKATPLSDAAVARIIEAVEAHCGMGRGAWDMVAARDLVEGFAAVFGADTSRIDADARRLLVARINGVADGYRRAADALRSMALNTGSRALSKRHAIQLAKQLEAAADAIGAGMAADTQTEGESDGE